MKLPRKLRSFLSMTGADRWLICEAIVMLGLAQVIVITIPFRHMVPWLSRVPDTGTCDEALVLSVRKALATAARNVPWDAACLPQAIAAKAMLRRRGFGSSFHLGADFDDGKIIAHAWLVVGDTVVVGGAGITSVTPLAHFG